jgi:DNA polymerase III epsilon subunit-like protein
MIIVGVDTETNGESSENEAKAHAEHSESGPPVSDAEIIELGLVLFHVESKSILASYCCVFKVDRWSDEAENIHGIPQLLSNMMPDGPPFDPWDIINGDMADFVVAHQATHDHPLVTKRWPSFLKKPWLCTRLDLPHMEAVDADGDKIINRHVISTRLGHLCVDYGIPLHGWHRALADAEACARIAACHDLNKALAFKNADKFKLIASGGFIKQINELLKEAPSLLKGGKRYQWDSEHKTWWKENLTEDEVRVDHKYIKKITNGKWEFAIEKMSPKSY